jgi:hypothetical protein
VRRAKLGPPLRSPRRTAPPNVAWSDEEWASIAKGHVSQEMEDKWDVFVFGTDVHFQRSWTGHAIYDCRFGRIDGAWRIVDVLVCGDESIYTGAPSEAGEAIRLESLIRNVLVHGQ